MSKRRAILVDGHSVVFSLEDLRALQRDSPRRARDILCARLTRYADHTGDAVIVVFDGSGPEIASERIPGGIQVMYAPRGGAADDVIERLVGKYSEVYDIVVVTRDQAERTTVEGFGVDVIDPESLELSFNAAEESFRRRAKGYYRDG